MELSTSEPRLIDWTGERCVPWADAPEVIYEHLHRYVFAVALARDKVVIDLGSGEGYGTGLLAAVAKSVLGVELDALSIAHAQANYRLDNVTFRCGSVLELDDLPDATFDLAVCFEMIEHIAEHDELLSTIARVLKPDGVLVVSTPDREEYSEAHDYHNPYHVKELNRAEFRDLLGQYFSHTALWTQSGAIRSIFQGVDDLSDNSLTQELAVRRIDDHWEPTDPVVPPYMVAVASPSPLPALPGLSVFCTTQPPQEEFGGINQVAKLKSQLEEAENSQDLLRAKIAHYSAAHEREMNQMRDHVANLEARAAMLDAERIGLGQQLVAREAQVAEILASSSWKATRPIRLAGRVARSLRRRATSRQR